MRDDDACLHLNLWWRRRELPVHSRWRYSLMGCPVVHPPPRPLPWDVDQRNVVPQNVGLVYIYIYIYRAHVTLYIAHCIHNYRSLRIRQWLSIGHVPRRVQTVPSQWLSCTQPPSVPLVSNPVATKMPTEVSASSCICALSEMHI